MAGKGSWDRRAAERPPPVRVAIQALAAVVGTYDNRPSSSGAGSSGDPPPGPMDLDTFLADNPTLNASHLCRDSQARPIPGWQFTLGPPMNRIACWTCALHWVMGL